MRRNEKVLVVDDDASVLDAISMVLRYEGFDVLTARNPYDAIELWRENPAEIGPILIDLDLGSSLNGHELAEYFRKQDPGVMTILLTAYPLDSRCLGRLEGVNYFQKPFVVSSLVAAVSRIMSPATTSQVIELAC